MSKGDMGAMQRFIESIDVESIVHFTRLENLPSILQHGLVGRQGLQERDIRHAINDDGRFDYLPDAICTSISFPNYKMFYRLRDANRGVDWVVLRIRPAVLWTKRCAFCQTNAATREVAQISVEERMTSEALMKLFAEQQGAPARATLRIPPCYPTNPQAEVLVQDPIEVREIIDVVGDVRSKMRNVGAWEALKSEYGRHMPFRNDKSLFDPRSDWSHWKT